MSRRQSTVLQIDFDGTVVEGDASTGILARFVDAAWTEKIEAASAAMREHPGGTNLIDTMTEAYALLTADREACLRYTRACHPMRDGLVDLVQTAERLGAECHIVSNGFQFYIEDYLRAAGVEGRLALHCGHERDGPRCLVYTDPSGEPVRGDFKTGWARYLRGTGNRLIYVGDGTSDVAAARLADVVFARDSLFSTLKSGFAGVLYPFEDLHDVARGLVGQLS